MPVAVAVQSTRVGSRIEGPGLQRWTLALKSLVLSREEGNIIPI